MTFNNLRFTSQGNWFQPVVGKGGFKILPPDLLGKPFIFRIDEVVEKLSEESSNTVWKLNSRSYTHCRQEASSAEPSQDINDLELILRRVCSRKDSFEWAMDHQILDNGYTVEALSTI